MLLIQVTLIINHMEIILKNLLSLNSNAPTLSNIVNANSRNYEKNIEIALRNLRSSNSNFSALPNNINYNSRNNDDQTLL